MNPPGYGLDICFYDAVNLKKMVRFYVPTWTLFAGLVTYLYNNSLVLPQHTYLHTGVIKIIYK